MPYCDTTSKDQELCSFSITTSDKNYKINNVFKNWNYPEGGIMRGGGGYRV